MRLIRFSAEIRRRYSRLVANSYYCTSVLLSLRTLQVTVFALGCSLANRQFLDREQVEGAVQSPWPIRYALDASVVK